MENIPIAKGLVLTYAELSSTVFLDYGMIYEMQNSN